MTTSNMEKVVKILHEINKSHCKILFGEATRFSEWLKEKGIKNKVKKTRTKYLLLNFKLEL
jgi:hypothetical protein